MSDAVEKAEAAAREAAVNTAAVQIALAAVELAKTAQAQPQQQCQHHQGKPARGAGEWLAIGCAVCFGGIGLALGFIAIAIGSVSVALLALILRSIWQDIRKGR